MDNNGGETIELERLAELQPILRTDPLEIRELFPTQSRVHPGRMRVTLALELIEAYLRRIGNPKPTVADPLVGIGATGVATILAGGYRFIGCEIVKGWLELAKAALDSAKRVVDQKVQTTLFNMDASTWKRKRCNLDLLITSPPFPNAHSQGASAMQQNLRTSKSTYAGNDFRCNSAWGIGATPIVATWISELERILKPWLFACKSGSPILIHVKNFVRRGQEVRVDLWVAEALTRYDEIEILGYHPVPLSYRSAFQEWRRFPRRRIINRWKCSGSGGWVEQLECGHRKQRKSSKARLPHKAVCTECGPIKGIVEIREERVVVAVKR